jgi:hypothetical protein
LGDLVTGEFGVVKSAAPREAGNAANYQITGLPIAK